MTPDKDKYLASAQDLTSALTDLSERLGDTLAYGHRNRRMIWGLIISLALDLVLTAGLTISLIQSDRASNEARSVHRQQVVICESGNEGRALNVKLWTYVLSIPPPQSRTHEQEKRVAEFKVFLTKTFAPRDCGKV